MSFDRITTAGYHTSSLFGTVSDVELQQYAADVVARHETEKTAVKKLAHFAADAEDFRTLADILGLDLSLLKED